MDPIKDAPFTFVEIKEKDGQTFNGMKTYQIELTGNAQQYSDENQVQISQP